MKTLKVIGWCALVLVALVCSPVTGLLALTMMDCDEEE